jgi:hypothetical protein
MLPAMFTVPCASTMTGVFAALLWKVSVLPAGMLTVV